MHKLENLKIWNKAIELATDVYQITSDFPTEEKYGLTSQIRRSAVSVSSNIAEGAGRNSKREFVHFLAIANGSAYELQTQLIISNKLSLVKENEVKLILNKINEIQKMNFGLQSTLN